MGATRAYRAVIFDVGGVVVDSPLDAIATYEREIGIEPGLVNRVVVSAGAAGAWARLERGELGLETFYAEFERECTAAGGPLSARELMGRIATAARPRPSMLEAIARIRRRGLRAGALTNNWPDQEDGGTEALRSHFDVFVESRVEGLRKPDPRIYRITCERLGVEPPEAVFLDDIGRNLKAARELGMTTLKVGEPTAALRTLGELLGFGLRS